jgi:hypothetical protein
MKELQVKAEKNSENKIITMEPLNKATGDIVETEILTARLYTSDEINREYADLMQDGCRTYKRKRGRIREIK